MLHSSLLYLSEAAHAVDEAFLKKLASHAEEKNKRINITGYLYYCKGVYLQYLEGDKTAITNLFQVIDADTRHNVKNVVEMSTDGVALFPDWSMRYVSDHEIREVGIEALIENSMRAIGVGESFSEEESGKLIRRLCEAMSKIYTK